MSATEPKPSEVAHLDWTRQASIYEVNIRQFTPEGSFQAMAAHLPRLQRMGVGMLWVMPIQAIGAQNRKGPLGSYYAIADYTGVNPEFGTLEDFKQLVAQAHRLGMKVILDWVANHTAWDHPWVQSHKERYKLNAQGEVFSVTFGSGPTVEYWTDVVGLNYQEKSLWPAMTEAMAYWLREADVDGFRCDVASLVPTAFWEQARATLDRIKPVFMLAESDAPELHAKAFDMTYDWDLFDQLKKIAQGDARAELIHAWWQRRQAKYPTDAYRMTFTGNHDSNSWHGCDAELYGTLPAFQAMAVLAATLPGMPMVYGGQESFFTKRLAFFEKDPIAWGERPMEALYTELLHLKKTKAALANGAAGGTLRWLPTGNPAVLAFSREAGADSLTVEVNLSAQEQVYEMSAGQPARLKPWGWRWG